MSLTSNKPMRLVIRAVVWGAIASLFDWFIQVAFPWLIFLPLCWHLISALQVNAAETWEQYQRVKSGCLELQEVNPSSFEWDGLRCVYPEPKGN